MEIEAEAWWVKRLSAKYLHPPSPGPGQTHRYFFKLYGPDTMLQLEDGVSGEDLIQAMHGHVVQYGETCVTYGR
ncbi:hypothetical protein [uncultured Methanoregula sp.]|uniref:hypothetical protein n=1 Tax=uncultured Methanoregula sp. TaxID=1005933 RepID=UPI002AAA83F6|nr:hypothetical protein [uncultured Methanoregula sp.]